MDDEKLRRNLRSIGMECFVRYFDEFSDMSRSNMDVAEVLMRETDYTDKSCLSRTSHARSIIRAGRARDALIVISESDRVSHYAANRAKELLKI